MYKVVACLLAAVSARKSYLVKQEHNLTQPRVQASYDCNVCFYKDSVDSICMDYQAKWNMGWTFYQKDTASVSYVYSLQLYSEQSAAIHPFVKLPAFMFNDYTVTISNFKAQMILEFYTWKQQKLFCTNLYLQVQNILWKIAMTLQITECYAILLNCIANFEDWTSPTAKFFDKCSLSKNTEVDIINHQWTINPVYMIGDIPSNTVQGINCAPGLNPFFPIWRPVATMGQVMMANLMSYVEDSTPASSMGIFF